MGWRFRKSFGSKGFRVNLSKSGIGYSVGVKGYRITKTAKGNIRETCSFPGTGVSYVTETSGNNKSLRTTKQTMPLIVKKSSIYLLLFIIFTISLIICIPTTIHTYITKQKEQKLYLETFYDFNLVVTGDYRLNAAETFAQIELILTNLSSGDKDYDITVNLYSKDDPSTLIASGKAGTMGTGIRLASGQQHKFVVILTAPEGGRIKFKAGTHEYNLQITTDVTDNGFAPPRPDNNQ